MTSYKYWSGGIIFGLFLFSSGLIFSKELIVVKNFRTSYPQIVNDIQQKIKTIIIRSANFDYLSSEDLKNTINNNFPEEKIDNCESLDCILRFKNRLPLLYLLEGEIIKEGEMYIAQLEIYNLKTGYSCHFRTPYLSLEEASFYVLNGLFQLLGEPEKEPLPPPPKQENLNTSVLEKELAYKKETLRRLLVEKENLHHTLAILEEKLSLLSRMAKENKKED